MTISYLTLFPQINICLVNHCSIFLLYKTNGTQIFVIYNPYLIPLIFAPPIYKWYMHIYIFSLERGRDICAKFVPVYAIVLIGLPFYPPPFLSGHCYLWNLFFMHVRIYIYIYDSPLKYSLFFFFFKTWKWYHFFPPPISMFWRSVHVSTHSSILF